MRLIFSRTISYIVWCLLIHSVPIIPKLCHYWFTLEHVACLLKTRDLKFTAKINLPLLSTTLLWWLSFSVKYFKTSLRRLSSGNCSDNWLHLSVCSIHLLDIIHSCWALIELGVSHKIACITFCLSYLLFVVFDRINDSVTCLSEELNVFSEHAATIHIFSPFIILFQHE